MVFYILTFTFLDNRRRTAFVKLTWLDGRVGGGVVVEARKVVIAFVEGLCNLSLKASMAGESGQRPF
jgi:hypothetical protein